MSTQKSSLETLIAKLSDGAFMQRAWTDLKLGYWLMKQRDVPILAKLVPIAAVAYVLAPVDLVPDMVPVLGQMDDVAIIMLGLRAFLRMAPPTVTARYEADIADAGSDNIVEGEVSSAE